MKLRLSRFAMTSLLCLSLPATALAAAGEEGDTPPKEEAAKDKAPAAAEPAKEAAKPAPAEAAGRMSEAYDALDHVMALDSLNSKADAIQAKISATLDRVTLLRESVIIGSITPSRLVIKHVNDMGASFTLEQIAYVLDGEVLLSKVSKDRSLDAQKEFEILNGEFRPGTHELSVSMVFKGSGYGLFSYFKGYRFRIDSKYKFKVAEGRLTRLNVVAHPRQDITLAPKDRLGIRYDYEVGTFIPDYLEED